MAEIIAAIICSIFSIGSFIISIRSFMEKGYLFNNAYLYATKEERIQMNKRAYYRQSAVVFMLMGILFLLTAVLALFYIKWIFYIVMAITAIMIVYAVGSSIIIEKRNKNCN